MFAWQSRHLWQKPMIASRFHVGMDALPLLSLLLSSSMAVTKGQGEGNRNRLISTLSSRDESWAKCRDAPLVKGRVGSAATSGCTTAFFHAGSSPESSLPLSSMPSRKGSSHCLLSSRDSRHALALRDDSLALAVLGSGFSQGKRMHVSFST